MSRAKGRGEARRLVALGLPPTAAIFSKALGGSTQATASADGAGNTGPDLWRSLQELPPTLAWISLVLIVVFVATKVYVIQANTEKKLALAESNTNQFRNFGDELETPILEQAQPMKSLNELLGQIITLKKLCVTQDIYPWNPFPSDADFLTRCTQRSDELIHRFQDNWQAPPPNPSLRQREPYPPGPSPALSAAQ